MLEDDRKPGSSPLMSLSPPVPGAGKSLAHSGFERKMSVLAQRLIKIHHATFSRNWWWKVLSANE